MVVKTVQMLFIILDRQQRIPKLGSSHQAMPHLLDT
jgi:hypothetical protein